MYVFEANDDGAGKVNYELHCGDCLEIMPTLPKVDAVITDPPYGISWETSGGMTDKGGWNQFKKYGWDNERPRKEIFYEILRISNTQIIWGGNYFTDYLPPSMQWLIWDKGQRNFSLSDFEMAWSSQHRGCRIFEYARALALQDGKEHPTQKPVAVMRWCIEQIKPKPRVILDPFAGSGSTGVACAQLGIDFIGIEINPDYFAIAQERIRKATFQPSLFTPQPEQWQRQELFAAD